MKFDSISEYDIANSFESGILIIDDSLNPILMNHKGFSILGLEEDLMMDKLPAILYSFGLHNFIEGKHKGLREKIN